jgi:acyl-CoA thioester hydrolase
MDGAVRLTVAYADTDAGGVMYHGRYVELAERSRLQWMLDTGHGLNAIAERFDVHLVLHKLQAEFDRPARLEDTLVARTALMAISAARATWRTDIYRGEDRLARLQADVVAVSASRHALTRFSDDLLQLLSPRVSEGVERPRAPAPLIRLFPETV